MESVPALELATAMLKQASQPGGLDSSLKAAAEVRQTADLLASQSRHQTGEIRRAKCRAVVRSVARRTICAAWFGSICRPDRVTPSLITHPLLRRRSSQSGAFFLQPRAG